MLKKVDVVELYLKYGFELGEENEKYLVFLSQSGYFQNAEIVILDEKLKEDSINKKEIEDIGYSVRVRKYSDINAVHDALFNGFFSTAVSNRKFNHTYTQFCEQQKNKLGNNYEYISGDYIENGSLQDNDVIERIVEILNKDDRQLIILEASAGFGKTCTSFEVVKTLIDKMPTKIPLLTELSKNRKARVFRYVLLSEIDQKFPSLSSELVTSEIMAGRIILVIDGFDELLSKGSTEQSDSDKTVGKDAQTMLDTIAQLIPEGSKTKILLTSRKSSIFVGDNFDNWVTQYLIGCNITRLQLSQPSLKDWIGAEKIELLRKNNISLNNILNPVLLTILRNDSIEEFESKYTSNEKLIEQYLELLLQREKTRQSLPLSVDEQLFIMRGLSAEMVKMDITAEDVDLIKLILTDVVSTKIDDYLNRYDTLVDSSETKPTEVEFINKLSQHALLDRISMQNNQIGFINDFIFGLMIAHSTLRGQLSINELSGKYIDIATTAFSAHNFDKRKELYDLITPSISKESAQRQIGVSLNLLGTIVGKYENEYFDGMLFGKNISIADDNIFNNCIFSDCVFDTCNINVKAFKTCQFYNCSFYNNSFEGRKDADCELTFLACTGHEQFASLAYCDKKSNPSDNSIDYERVILEQFWKPGYDMAEPNRSFQALFKGFSNSDRAKLVDAIEQLVKKGILIKRIRVYELNVEKIDSIKSIIGR